MFVNDTISSLAPLIRVNNRRFSEFTYLVSHFTIFSQWFSPFSPLSLFFPSFSQLINNISSINKESHVLYLLFVFLGFKSSLRKTWNYRRLDTYCKLFRKIRKGLKLIARYARHPFDARYCFCKSVWRRTFLMIRTTSVLLNTLHNERKKKRDKSNERNNTRCAEVSSG